MDVEFFLMKFRKIYLEISNVCNLNCSFCPGTNRTPKVMNTEEFSLLLPKLRPYSDFIYFHLMGEPLLHPNLADFLKLAGDIGFRIILTTNGTLLAERSEVLLNAAGLHKVNISLHAFEANDLRIPFDTYLNRCLSYGKAAEGRKITVFRLWNQGGADALNGHILEQIRHFFPEPWIVEPRGTRIGDKVYLEYGDKFDWPDLSAQEHNGRIFCHALRDQIGVLCDGTVVPCCLDHNGDIPLGNLFSDSMDSILSSEKARALYEGFSGRAPVEALCRRCGYALRFQK